MNIRIIGACFAALTSTLTLSAPALAHHASDPAVGHYDWQLVPHTGTKEVARGGRYVWVGPQAMASAGSLACDAFMKRSSGRQRVDCMKAMTSDAVSSEPDNG